MISRRGVLTIAGAAALAGCSRGRGDRLTWWAIGPEGEYAPVLLQAVTRGTGLRVDSQALPWTAAHEKLLTAFAGGSLPDVMMVKNDWLPELAMIGALAPVLPGGDLLDGHFASSLASASVAGRAVAVPWVVEAWVQFYRTDLLARAGYAAPPTHWDDWLRMARGLKRRWPDRHVTLHLLDWPEPLFTLAAQQGDPLLRDRATRGNFSSPGFLAALERYKLIYDEGFSPAVQGNDFGDTLIALRRGQLSILPANAETVGDLQRRTAWFPPDLWNVAETPGPGGPAAGLANGYSIAVSRGARSPAQAWRLVEALCGAKGQLQLRRILNDLPSRAAVWSAPELADDHKAAVFGRAVRRNIAPPAVPEWERITVEVQLVAEQMVRRVYGVTAAAAEMDRRVDGILAKRRWLLDRGMAA